MKISTIVFLFASVLVLSTQCQSPATTGEPAKGEPASAEPGPDEALYQTWMHSQEEDTADKMVYRPEGFAFPPARGRTGFKLEKGGKGVAYEIAPTDGTLTVPLNWTLAHDILSMKLEDGQRRQWQILTLNKEVLEVKGGN
jgi:hypothetical protein